MNKYTRTWRHGAGVRNIASRLAESRFSHVTTRHLLTSRGRALIEFMLGLVIGLVIGRGCR